MMGYTEPRLLDCKMICHDATCPTSPPITPPPFLLLLPPSWCTSPPSRTGREVHASLSSQAMLESNLPEQSTSDPLTELRKSIAAPHPPTRFRGVPHRKESSHRREAYMLIGWWGPRGGRGRGDKGQVGKVSTGQGLEGKGFRVRTKRLDGIA